MSDSQKPAQSAQERLAQVELELKEKELELKKIQLQRELRLSEKTEHEINEFDNQKATRLQELHGRGQALKAQTDSRRNLQKNCPHRMGGKGVEGIYTSTAQGRSVVKFELSTGELLIRCTRCRKEWIPPLPTDYLKVRLDRKNYKTEPEWLRAVSANIDQGAYDKAKQEYEEAVSFDNGGMAIGSFGRRTVHTRDGVDIAREKTHAMCVGGKNCAL